MARPSKLTPQTSETITRELAAGASTAAAARAADISARTLRRWLQHGRNSADGTYRQLVADVEDAKRQARQRAIKTIGGAGEVDWRAAAWLLERLFPDEFGRPTRARDL